MATAVANLTLRDAAGVILDQRTGAGEIQLETHDLDFGDGFQDKYVEILFPEITDGISLTGMLLSLGYKERIEDPIVWEVGQQIQTGRNPLYFRRTAKFFRIKISGATNQAFFILSAIDIFGQFDKGRL